MKTKQKERKIKMKNITFLTFVIGVIILLIAFSGCDKKQSLHHEDIPHDIIFDTSYSNGPGFRV